MHLDSYVTDVNLYLKVSFYMSLLGLKVVLNVTVNVEDALYSYR